MFLVMIMTPTKASNDDCVEDDDDDVANNSDYSDDDGRQGRTVLSASLIPNHKHQHQVSASRGTKRSGDTYSAL